MNKIFNIIAKIIFIASIIGIIIGLYALIFSEINFILDGYYFPPDIPEGISNWLNPILSVFLVIIYIIVFFSVGSEENLSDLFIFLITFFVIILIVGVFIFIFDSMLGQANYGYGHLYKKSLLIFIILSLLAITTLFILGTYCPHKDKDKENKDAMTTKEYAVTSASSGVFFAVYLLPFGIIYAFGVGLIITSFLYGSAMYFYMTYKIYIKIF